MKLLKQFSSVQDAEQAASFLRSHGIVTHVSTVPESLGVFIVGQIGVRLWAVLDHQYIDAVKVLEDERHTVNSGLSSSELDEFERTASANVFQSLNKAIVVGLLLIAVMVYLVIEVAL